MVPSVVSVPSCPPRRRFPLPVVRPIVAVVRPSRRPSRSRRPLSARPVVSIPSRVFVSMLASLLVCWVGDGWWVDMAYFFMLFFITFYVSLNFPQCEPHM